MHAFRFSLLSFFLGTALSFSDTRHTDLVNSIQTQKKRPPVTDNLTPEEVLFLTKGFFRAEESIQIRFNDKSKNPELFLPEAITSATKAPRNEESIAKIFAELSGSLNLKQIEKLKEDSAELTQLIRDKEPTDRDLRLLTLIERSEWLGYILEGKTPPASSLPSSSEEKSFADFKIEFLKHHKEVVDNNKEFLKTLDEAKKGNKTQKEKVRSQLDFKSLGTYLEGQVEFGNEDLAKDLSQAIVWKDDSGNHYHDFSSADGAVNKRVFVSESSSQNLNQLLDFWSSKASKVNGKALTVSPTKILNPNLETVNLTGKPVKGVNNSPQNPSTQNAQALIQAKCTSCHRHTNGFNPGDNALAVQNLKSGAMPQDPITITPEERALLIDYFSRK